MQTATASDLNFDNFVAFNSDNAAYVKEAFSDSLATLFPSCVHITCLAHIINLLGDAFKKSFHEVTTFVKNMNAIFLACWGSKRQISKIHVYEKCHSRATMLPSPIGTRRQ